MLKIRKLQIISATQKIATLTIIFLVTGKVYGSAERKPFFDLNQYNISANYYRGYISDKQKLNHDVVNNYINALNISVSKIPDGSKNWHSVYHFPETGIEFFYINTGNPEVLGSVFSVSRYIDFNLYNNRSFDIDARTSLGAAYTPKVFHPNENYKNIFFSKPVNFFFQLNLGVEYKITKNSGWYLNGGFSLCHVSNGETKLPNEGISASSVFIGLSRKNFTNQPPEVEKSEYESKKIVISILPSIGWKENWRYGSEKYLELSFSTDFLYKLNRKQLVGLGCDLFYDETRKAYSNHNTEPVTTDKEALSGGVHVAHEFNLSPLYIVFKTGLHMINKEIVQAKNYNIVGIRYNIVPSLYVSLYHKSHDLFYGDNMQWGIGFVF